jgi:hypothetical protein
LGSRADPAAAPTVAMKFLRENFDSEITNPS